MTTAQRKMLLAPASTQGVQIAGTNTTCHNLDINIVVLEWLWLDIIELEIRVMLGISDLKSLESIWIDHIGGWIVQSFNGRCGRKVQVTVECECECEREIFVAAIAIEHKQEGAEKSEERKEQGSQRGPSLNRSSNNGIL